MNKEHFLIELKLHLRQLPLIEQQAILDKYEALFDKKLEQGMTEYQITKELGSPTSIATAILKEFNIELKEIKRTNNDWVEISENNIFEEIDYDDQLQTNNYASSNSGFIRFFQITGIIFLNLFFMIWMIFSWALLLFGGWLVTVMFILSPILAGISFISFLGPYGLFQLSISILFLGLGLIGLLILIPFSKISFKLFKTYFKWNFQVLKGERAL